MVGNIFHVQSVCFLHKKLIVNSQKHNNYFFRWFYTKKKTWIFCVISAHRYSILSTGPVVAATTVICSLVSSVYIQVLISSYIWKVKKTAFQQPQRRLIYIFLLLSGELGTSALVSQQGFKLQHLQAQCVTAGLLISCEHSLQVVLLFFYMSHLDKVEASKLFGGDFSAALQCLHHI